MKGIRGCPPLLFFSIAALVMAGPHVLPLTRLSRFAYDHLDQYIFLWDFWWTKTSLLAGRNPYWSDLIYHPFGTSLAFATFPMPYCIMSLPVQLLVPGMAGLTIAFNLIVFFSFVISGLGAFRLADHVTGNRAGSLVAGIVFAFMPCHFLHMARLHMLSVEWLPFYVLALLHFRQVPTTRNVAAIAVWLALCFYSSTEYALYLLIFSVMWLGYVHMPGRGGLRRSHWIGLAKASLLFLIIAAPLLLQQVRFTSNARTFAVEPEISEVVQWSPALLSFVTPSRVHPVYGQAFEFAGTYPGSDKVGMRSSTSLGLVVLGLATLGAIGFRGGGKTLWILGAAVFLILSLGPQLRVTGTWLTGIPLPYRLLYEWIPPLRASRDPTRLVPVAMLMLSVLAAFGTSTILARFKQPRRRFLAAAALVALVLFEDLTPWPKNFTPSVSPIYEELAGVPGKAPIVDLTEDLSAMLAQTVHGKPVGYLVGIATRGVPTPDQFPIQLAFWAPQRILELDGERRLQVLGRLRESLRREGTSFLVFPVSRKSDAQAELSRLLGATSSVSGKYMKCDFRGS